MDALERIDAAVAKIGLLPTAVAGFVAEFTARRKSGGHVVRVSGLLVISAMAAIAISRRSGINPVLVTGAAIQRRMDTLAGKDAVVVEGSLIPAGVGRQMTEFARCRKSRLSMARFGRLLIIFSVAGKTVKGGQAEIAVLMATVTAQTAMGGIERHSRPGAVLPAHGGPGDRTVAVLAIAAQRCPVEVVLAPDPVTVIATRGCSFINTVQMAGGAGDLKVAAFKREGPRLVKTARDRFPAGGSMTGFAFLGHGALMRLGMTGTALSLIHQVRADLVAGRTILRQAGVLSFEGKAGLGSVVKVFRVEWPDIDVDALVLLVAGLAIARDLAVDSLFCGEPFSDRLMASQAAFGVDLLTLGMALPAVRLALQGVMRFGERTGSDELGLGILAGEAQEGYQKHAAEASGKSE